MLHFFQKRRSPIEHGVARDVDEEVGAGDEPQRTILENIVDQQLARAQLFLVCADAFFAIGIIVQILFDGRQAYGLRRVAQAQHEIDGADNRENARHIKRRAPAEPLRRIRGNDADQATAHILRQIPHAEDRAPFAHAVPVAERAPARRPSHALRQAVQAPQRQVRRITMYRCESKIASGRRQQPKRHKIARVAAVRKRAHHEPAQSVDRNHQGQHVANLVFAQNQRLAHLFRNHGQVVTDQIKRGVPDECGFKNLPAQFRIDLLRLLRRNPGNVRSRAKKTWNPGHSFPHAVCTQFPAKKHHTRHGRAKQETSLQLLAFGHEVQ